MGAILKKCFSHSCCEPVASVPINKFTEYKLSQLENTVSVMEKNMKDIENKNADLQVKYIVLETKHDTLLKRLGELKNEVKTDMKDATKQIKTLEAQVLNILMGHSEMLDDDIIIVHE
jgi:hypothetical protein